MRFGDAIIRSEFIIFRDGSGINRTAFPRLEQLREKKFGMVVAPVCCWRQPTPGFLHILWNTLSKKISRTQAKFALALSLLSSLFYTR